MEMFNFHDSELIVFGDMKAVDLFPYYLYNIVTMGHNSEGFAAILVLFH